MQKKKIYISLLLIFIFFLQSGCANQAVIPKTSNSQPVSSLDSFVDEENEKQSSDFEEAEFGVAAEVNVFDFSESIIIKNENESLTVHFIDVGQGNAILVESAGKYMLIDAGETDKAQIVQSYLQNIDVGELDYVVATHPHSDHIGGLPVILRNFSVKKMFMPDVQSQTLIFEDLLFAIQDTDLGITIPEPGEKYVLGAAIFTILAPIREYGENLNNASIALRLDFHNTSFLFAGDAEIASEKDMIAGLVDLDVDVFLANHHGSDTSNSENFLRALSPQYAVISVGADNTYGHPSVNVLERFQSFGIHCFRTDESGTIVAKSDGDTISWDMNNTPVDVEELIPPTEFTEIQVDVFITNSGAKYHRGDCRFIENSAIPILLEEAKSQGYSACSVCNPPD